MLIQKRAYMLPGYQKYTSDTDALYYYNYNDHSIGYALLTSSKNKASITDNIQRIRKLDGNIFGEMLLLLPSMHKKWNQK